MAAYLNNLVIYNKQLKSCFCICPQIGCFLGFSITACVIGVIMFISYCFAVSQFSSILNCREDWLFGSTTLKRPCSVSRSGTKRGEAADGMGLGVCQLILSALVFIVALVSSIYSCKAVCCGTSGHTVSSMTHVSWLKSS